jgi:hypothetical protein
MGAGLFRIAVWLFLACVVLPARGSAEVLIESVRWQQTLTAKRRQPVYHDILELSSVPPRITGRIRALLVLKNRGPQEAEGILLRYSIAARLVGLGSAQAGVWAVPFMIEEKRVPKIGPNQRLEVSLDPARSMDVPFNHYLQRIFSSGFWLDRIRLQVMLSPRQGAVETIKTEEAILPVKK